MGKADCSIYGSVGLLCQQQAFLSPQIPNCSCLHLYTTAGSGFIPHIHPGFLFGCWFIHLPSLFRTGRSWDDDSKCVNKCYQNNFVTWFTHFFMTLLIHLHRCGSRIKATTVLRSYLPAFPDIHLTACQNHFEADQKPLVYVFAFSAPPPQICIPLRMKSAAPEFLKLTMADRTSCSAWQLLYLRCPPSSSGITTMTSEKHQPACSQNSTP